MGGWVEAAACAATTGGLGLVACRAARERLRIDDVVADATLSCALRRLTRRTSVVWLACAGLLVPVGSLLAERLDGEAFSPQLSILACGMLVCAWTDAVAHRIFNDTLIVTLALIGAAAAVEGRLLDAAMGFAIVGGSALLLSLIPGVFAPGDVKLCAVIGTAFGALQGLEAILFTFGILLVVCAPGLMLGRLTRNQAIPLAPFFFAGALSVAVARSVLEGVLASGFAHG